MLSFAKWIRVCVPFFAAWGWRQETPVRPSGREELSQPALAAVGPDLWRVEGRDTWSGVHYLRVLLTAQAQAGGAEQPAAANGTADLNRATLTGQCTQEASGKLRFELFANFGGVPDAAFYPPWHSISREDLFPPGTRKVILTMEFLGYTKVKPYRRQFEEVAAPEGGQLRYVNPGTASSNLEAPGWFFQYLRALPTLRLSGEGHTAEFATAAWMAALHREPLCGASGA